MTSQLIKEQTPQTPREEVSIVYTQNKSETHGKTTKKGYKRDTIITVFHIFHIGHQYMKS